VIEKRGLSPVYVSPVYAVILILQAQKTDKWRNLAMQYFQSFDNDTSHLLSLL
jgi:hypothetical protein